MSLLKSETDKAGIFFPLWIMYSVSIECDSSNMLSTRIFPLYITILFHLFINFGSTMSIQTKAPTPHKCLNIHG
jgi:hypothetical protein